MTAPETLAVMTALTANGAVVRFVGGCVRDAVAGRAVTDIDIATPDAPEAVMALLKAAHIKAVPTGIAHGTITAVSGGKGFEITTLRRDVETDGRRAVVAFTDDWVEDSARRDLTFNALYCDGDGTLYDPQSGLDDLRGGRVRFVGDPAQRLAEDVLRILRFFRFQAQLGIAEMDRVGLAACRAAAAGLETLSGERIAQEMRKLLAAGAPTPTLRLMHETGVLAHILPTTSGGLDRLADLSAREVGLDLVDPIRRLSALLPGAEAATALAERWRLSNKDRARLPAALTPPDAFAADLSDRDQRWLLYRHGADLLIDWRLLAGADDVSLAQTWPIPRLPIRGRDILALGLEAGPSVGDILDAVETWWIDGDFTADADACLEQARHLMTPPTP